MCCSSYLCSWLHTSSLIVLWYWSCKNLQKGRYCKTVVTKVRYETKPGKKSHTYTYACTHMQVFFVRVLLFFHSLEHPTITWDYFISYSQDFKSVARTAGLHVLPSHSSWNLQREWNVRHRLTHAHQKTHNEINLFDSLHLHQTKTVRWVYMWYIMNNHVVNIITAHNSSSHPFFS